MAPASEDREDRKAYRLEFVKQATGMSSGLLKMRTYLVEGSDPSRAEKETAHGIRARDVGAPATQGVMVHRGKEKPGKHLDYGENLD
jgi:hypothetical protein